MIVTGWNNGAPNNKTAAGYGIRISLQDREKYFMKSWASEDVDFEEETDPVEKRLMISGGKFEKVAKILH